MPHALWGLRATSDGRDSWPIRSQVAVSLQPAERKPTPNQSGTWNVARRQSTAVVCAAVSVIQAVVNPIDAGEIPRTLVRRRGRICDWSRLVLQPPRFRKALEPGTMHSPFKAVTRVGVGRRWQADTFGPPEAWTWPDWSQFGPGRETSPGMSCKRGPVDRLCKAELNTARRSRVHRIMAGGRIPTALINVDRIGPAMVPDWSRIRPVWVGRLGEVLNGVECASGAV